MSGGLIPTRVDYKVDNYRYGTTLNVEYFVPVEDPLAREQAAAIMNTFGNTQTIFAKEPIESPLQWLDRRVREMTKLGALK